MPTNIEWTEWNPVPDFPGYSVNTLGKVRGPSGKTLILQYKDSGHAYVTTGPRHARKNISIHRAVWQVFGGPIPDGLEVRHLNGDQSDNRFVNFALGDRYDQRADDRLNGVVRRPAGLILDETKVSAIMQAKGQAPSRFVGDLFGVSHTTIQKIWRGERWQIIPR